MQQEGGGGGDEEEEKEEKEERLVAYDSDFVDDEEVDRVHGKARKKTKHTGFFVNEVRGLVPRGLSPGLPHGGAG
jgi:hypothetical protein